MSRLTRAIRHILRPPPPSLGPKAEIIDQFHRLYYDSQAANKTWRVTYWLGIQTLKCPLDLWIYQEIIFASRPDVIIETGTYSGGSAYFLATMCDLIGHGRIVSIDIEHRKGRPEHGRIQYLLGSSTTRDTVQRVKQGIGPKDSVMVILDSDHRAAHVRDELKTYAPLVTKGQYLIVEDTNVNGHPVFHHHGPGPMEALLEFLEGNQDFVIDEEKEKFLLTFNPRGYLLKVRP